MKISLKISVGRSTIFSFESIIIDGDFELVVGVDIASTASETGNIYAVCIGLIKNAPLWNKSVDLKD